MIKGSRCEPLGALISVSVSVSVRQQLLLQDYVYVDSVSHGMSVHFAVLVGFCAHVPVRAGQSESSIASYIKEMTCPHKGSTSRLTENWRFFIELSFSDHSTSLNWL